LNKLRFKFISNETPKETEFSEFVTKEDEQFYETIKKE